MVTSYKNPVNTIQTSSTPSFHYFECCNQNKFMSRRQNWCNNPMLRYPRFRLTFLQKKHTSGTVSLLNESKLLLYKHIFSKYRPFCVSLLQWPTASGDRNALPLTNSTRYCYNLQICICCIAFVVVFKCKIILLICINRFLSLKTRNALGVKWVSSVAINRIYCWEFPQPNIILAYELFLGISRTLNNL
jgi:hypothetical protein